MTWARAGRYGILLVVLLTVANARAEVVDGAWVVGGRVALTLYPCEAAQCGRVVWLRNPALRTPSLCNRVVLWDLAPSSAGVWTGGVFFDPEDSETYSVNAKLVTPDQISARIYVGSPMLGRTETLTRIEPHSLPGWCQPPTP